MLKRKLFIQLLVLFIPIINGCSEGEQVTLEYFINKDGSGKVEIDYESSLSTKEELHNIDDVDHFIKEEADGYSFLLNKEIKKLVEESEGVKRWGELNYQMIGEENESFIKVKNSDYQKQYNRYKIQATAYFEDITKLNFAKLTDIDIYEFNKNHLKWRLPRNKELDAEINKPMKKERLQKNDKFFEVVAGSLMMALKNGLEINYIINLPKKVESAGSFTVDPSNKSTVKFILNEEKGEELVASLEQNFKNIDIEDSVVTPIDIITKAIFGSENERQIDMSSGLFSGKTKKYVSKDEITASSNYAIQEIELPNVKNLSDLYGGLRNSYQKLGSYEKILEDTSRLYADKNGTLYTGIVYTKEPKSYSKVNKVFKVKNGELQGDYWGFDNGQLRYKTLYKNNHPTFQTELIHSKDSVNYIQSQPLKIKDKWIQKGYIKHIHEDEDYMWLSGDEKQFKILRIDKESEEIKIFNELNIPINAKYANCMVVDTKGKKWVGTENGLFTFFNDNWQEISLKEITSKTPHLKDSKFISNIYFNPYDQSSWLLLSKDRNSKKALIQIDSSGNFYNHSQHIKNELDPTYKKRNVSYKFHENNLGFIDDRSNAGVYRYGEKKNEIIKLENENPYPYRYNNFIFDNEGGVMLSRRKGLVKFDSNLKIEKEISRDQFEGSDVLGSLIKDKNIIYFDTRDSRTKKMNKENIPSEHYLVSYNMNTGDTKIMDIPVKSLKSLHIDQNNRFWFLDTEDNLLLSDEHLNSFEKVKYYDTDKLPRFYEVIKDEGGSVFISEDGRKKYKYISNLENWKAIDFQLPNSLKGKVLTFANDKWFIPTGRNHNESVIYSWKNSNWSKQELPTEVRNHIYENGVLSKDGLYLLYKPTKDTDHFKLIHYSHNGWETIKLPSKDIRKIELISTNEGLWMHIRKKGLFNYGKDEKWNQISGSENWGYVYSIIDAGENELIVSILNGLVIKTTNNDWNKYTLSNTGINFGSISDAVRDKENRIILSSRNPNIRRYQDENESLNLCKLFIYEKGNWQVLAGVSNNVKNGNYDYQSLMIKDKKLFLATLRNGILEADLD
ncbi:hypothetical protein ABWH96_11240 [Marivirga tractuosa]|uniref:hypothetical protein n=1 Tax=Marivirga tractuosa TaxID=1006 RepID=UPI0035CF416E